jgi:hypothetical protein
MISFMFVPAEQLVDLELTAPSLVFRVAALILLCTIAVGIYRLWLSPIADFPGPRLAALTFWYEGYYDVVRDGQYSFKIQELHDTYGPVVRINPCELHVSDAEFYHTLYVGGSSRRTNKWYWSARMFG